jgi:hypothetical protein
MKKFVFILCTVAVCFSCSQESNELNEINNPDKKVLLNPYEEPVIVMIENNTTSDFSFNFILKPRYIDSFTSILQDTEGVMPNGLSCINVCLAGETKYYNYGIFYPFKDMLNEAGIPSSIYDYWAFIERYCISHVEFTHPITGEFIKLSTYESFSNHTFIGSNNYFLAPEGIPHPIWDKEIFYKDGPSSATVNLPGGGEHYFSFRMYFSARKIVLTIE